MVLPNWFAAIVIGTLIKNGGPSKHTLMKIRVLQYKISKIIGLIFGLEIFLMALFGIGWYLVEFKLNGVRFDVPWLVFGALGGVLFSLFFAISLARKNKRIAEFGDPKLLGYFIDPISSTKTFVKFSFWRTAMFLLCIAASNPKIGSKSAEGKSEGIDLVFAIDVSNSMLAEDVVPNRLSGAKRAVEKIIDGLHGDRIGLVVFAGQSYIQMPLTSDHSALSMYLQGINTDLISTQGTAMGNAINLSLRCFDFEHPANKAIILITDGENHEDDATVAAERAAEQGVIIHAVGLGSEKGSPIPDYRNGRKVGFKKDKGGNTVVSKTNVAALSEIAEITGGTTTLIQTGSIQVNGVIDAIDGMQKAELSSVVYTDFEDRFQWFLLPGILLILMELLVTEKYQVWLERLNFFGKA
ncbi:MAG: Ca-activated chloride channel family protein [Luteibaculaceae bacterium]